MQAEQGARASRSFEKDCGNRCKVFQYNIIEAHRKLDKDTLNMYYSPRPATAEQTLATVQHGSQGLMSETLQLFSEQYLESGAEANEQDYRN